MKKNFIIALALATSLSIPAFADEASATTTVQAPALATTQPAADTQAVQDPALATTQPAADTQAVQDPTLATTQTQPLAEAPARKAIGVFMDVNVGTLGIGMNIGYEFNRYLKLRLRGSYLAADYDDTWNDDKIGSTPLDGKFEFDGSSIGLMLDYHPFGGTFHLTGGLNFSGMKLDAKATMVSPENLDVSRYNGVYEFGGHRYEVAGLGEKVEAQVKARYEWNKVQPYLGFGWSSNGKGTHSIYFSCDIGVNFIGKGDLKVSHSGAEIKVEQDGQFVSTPDIDSLLEQSLREEGKDFFDIADKIIVYPVIQFGIGGRF